MKSIKIKTPEINVRCVDGVPNVTVTAGLVETLETIGRELGIYFIEDRDERVAVEYYEDKRPARLVRQQDVSHHGAPCWITTNVITADSRLIQQYLDFCKLLEYAKKPDA